MRTKTTSYVWCKKRKRLITKATAMKDAVKQSRQIIINDIEPYLSIASDRIIGGRAAKREDLKRTGCVEYEPTMRKYTRDDGIQRTVDRAFERFRG